MSPEQQERPDDELSTGKLNEKIDIYALGNIFYKIAVGNSPWKVSGLCSSFVTINAIFTSQLPYCALSLDWWLSMITK